MHLKKKRKEDSFDIVLMRNTECRQNAVLGIITRLTDSNKVYCKINLQSDQQLQIFSVQTQA